MSIVQNKSCIPINEDRVRNSNNVALIAIEDEDERTIAALPKFAYFFSGSLHDLGDKEYDEIRDFINSYTNNYDDEGNEIIDYGMLMSCITTDIKKSGIRRAATPLTPVE